LNISLLDAQLVVVAKLIAENTGLAQEIERLRAANEQLSARLTQPEVPQA
jgi:cell division protein FtsB